MQQLHIFFLVLSLLAFVFALVAAISTRRTKFSGYGEIIKDVGHLAQVLKAEVFRDDTYLVVRGNYGQHPVLVRFALAKDSSGLSITMQAPANFAMSVTPSSAPERQEGKLIRTEDGIFDLKFTIASRQPAMARMFVSSTGTLPLIKKLCWSSSTSLRMDSGKLELLERPFEVADVFGYVQNYVAIMAHLAEKLGVMPGADAIRIVPFRKPGSRVFKPAVALALAVALLQASRISGAGAAQQPVLAAESPIPEALAPSDAARILYLQGWHLAQEPDFDSDAIAWLRFRGANPSATVRADFSGKNNGRDVAYIFIDDQGTMRVVLISAGRLVYDQRYKRILAVAPVSASNLTAVDWRSPLPGKADGDGLLLVTKSENSGSSLMLALRDGSLMLGSPTDYQKVVF